MIEPSFFMDKSVEPRLSDIKALKPEAFPFWEQLIAFVYANYPKIKEEWTHPWKKHGWSFRLRSKKRVMLKMKS